MLSTTDNRDRTRYYTSTENKDMPRNVNNNRKKSYDKI